MGIKQNKLAFFVIVLLLHCYCFGYQNNNDSIPFIVSDVYLYKNQAKYSQAFKKASQLLKISEQEDQPKLAGIAHLNFAEIHFSMGGLDQALKFASAAEQEFVDGKDSYYLAMSKLLKARLLAHPEIATSNQTEVTKLFNEATLLLNSNKNLAEYLSNISLTEALIEKDRGEYAKAIILYEKSLPLKNKNEEDFLTAKIFLGLSECYLARNNIDRAKNNIAKAEEYAEIFNFQEILLKTLLCNSKVFEKEGDLDKALEYSKQYQDKLIALYDIETIRDQKLYADRSEIEFKNKLIESINKNNKENTEKLNKSNLASIFTSALLIIISLLTVSLYRNNKIKLKTNELLVKKNKELLTAKENAERAMKAKTQFLSTVSHELRTPLYAVTGLTHLLLQENPTDNQKEYLKSLKFSGEYLLTFINDILQINKIEAKKLTIQYIPFNLEEIMSDVINSLSQTSKESNNVIELQVDKGIPAQLIGDPLKLSQIFINLVGNAIKFTENGKVILQAKVIENLDNHVTIHFEVEDNGIGISEEVQKNIFESFSQGSIQINRKYGGTGLGLNIVKSLLELLKSEIKLESQIGKGSKFYFDINFERVKDAEIEIDEIKEDFNPDDVIQNLHLLLVEDNKINQVITKKMLMQKNITCDIADNGYKAIELAQNNEYDAILMDIHMPGISGLTATKEIRKFNKVIPIIALTAISLDENTDGFYEVGCNDIITKPFKPDEFYKKIAKNILENLRLGTLPDNKFD